MSDTGSNDPYDPNRRPEPGDSTPPPPPPPPPPPSQPQWGSNPPPPAGGDWPGGQQGQPDQPSHGQPQYGQPPYGGAYGQPAGTPPPNYLVWAILTLIFCCWPLSIASIVFAAQVNGKFEAGDLAGAAESSRKAKQFAVWSAIAAVILFGLIILLFVVGAVAGSDSTT